MKKIYSETKADLEDTNQNIIQLNSCIESRNNILKELSLLNGKKIDKTKKEEIIKKMEKNIADFEDILKKLKG